MMNMLLQMCISVSSARKVHFFFLRESKMYTSGSIASSHRMLTKINENSTIAKISISKQSDTVKHLKAFRIISSETPILLILS